MKKFMLNLPDEITNQLIQLMKWKDIESGGRSEYQESICQAITSEYCRVANVMAIRNMKADLAIRAEGCKDASDR
jgi:hypothetical protein